MLTVTSKAERARKNGHCLYCQQPVGGEHKPDCVTVVKRVRIRMIVEYEVEVPAAWDKDMIEFHRNDGSWCTDNAISELEALSEKEGCLCNAARFEHVADVSGEPYVGDGG